jgi:hypothetical protein
LQASAKKLSKSSPENGFMVVTIFVELRQFSATILFLKANAVNFRLSVFVNDTFFSAKTFLKSQHWTQVYVGKFIPRKEREQELGEKAKRFTNVFIKNFGEELSEEDLTGMFSKYGNITSIKVSHACVRRYSRSRSRSQSNNF